MRLGQQFGELRERMAKLEGLARVQHRTDCGQPGFHLPLPAGEIHERVGRTIPRTHDTGAAPDSQDVCIGRVVDQLVERMFRENGGAKLDHRAANRSCFWAE